jgi:hypothetical protein
MSEIYSLSDSMPDQAPDRSILHPPMICAECGLPINTEQLADECELCGAPRCRTCASAEGVSLAGPYVCSDCAAEA